MALFGKWNSVTDFYKNLFTAMALNDLFETFPLEKRIKQSEI